jgi:hypothetical protein
MALFQGRKTSFDQLIEEFLRDIFSSDGISMDEKKKIQFIVEWIMPSLVWTCNVFLNLQIFIKSSLKIIPRLRLH